MSKLVLTTFVKTSRKPLCHTKGSPVSTCEYQYSLSCFEFCFNQIGHDLNFAQGTNEKVLLLFLFESFSISLKENK